MKQKVLFLMLLLLLGLAGGSVMAGEPVVERQVPLLITEQPEGSADHLLADRWGIQGITASRTSASLHCRVAVLINSLLSSNDKLFMI